MGAGITPVERLGRRFVVPHRAQPGAAGRFLPYAIAPVIRSLTTDPGRSSAA